MRRKMVIVSAVVCIVAVIVTGVSIAQPQGRGGQRPGGRQGGMFDPARMRQMMAERMKEQLGVDDQAWKVMEPRLMKVIDLNRQASGGRARGMFFMGGRRGPQGDQGDRGPGGRRGPQGPADRELTAVEKASEQLRTTLEDTAASPEIVKTQLTALRAAREKARRELAKARDELRQILTVRQEAQFVLMGMLD